MVTGQHHVAGRALTRGVRARAGAFDGDRHLLFLHGRNQQGRDPALLRGEWTAGLNRGLRSAGIDPVDADVHFPFYGDVLVESESRESPGAAAEEDTYEQLLTEAAIRLGMPSSADGAGPVADESLAGFGSGLLGRLHPQLTWIAARGGLDGFVIAQHFRDVAAYLSDESVRGRVHSAVLEATPDRGRLVLVSHSLGTVVALDLLSRLPGAVEVDLLVTAGSPVGMDAVYRKLQTRGPVRPERVGHWLNVWYPGDPVAIGCPLRDTWGGQLGELAVDNPSDRAHDIAEYLAHDAAAAVIGRRLALR